jgi:hypothetical protein
MYTMTIWDKDFYLSSEKDWKHIRVVWIDNDLWNFTRCCRELVIRFNVENIEVKQSDNEALFLRLCTEIYCKLI